MAIQKTSATKLRKENKPYEAISRQVVDSLESAEALAIWVYLQMRPQNWTVRRADIMSKLKIGRDRYYRGLNELKDKGLVEDILQKEEGSGKIIDRVLVVYPEPRKNRDAGKPYDGKTVRRENGTLKEVHSNKDLQTTKSVNKLTDASRLVQGVKEKQNARREAIAKKAVVPTKANVAAVWNTAITRHTDKPYTLLSNSNFSAMTLNNNSVNLKLDEGEWKKIMTFSIEHWQYLRQRKFNWMVKSPMPEVPSFKFYSYHVKFFTEYYNAATTAKDGADVNKNSKRESAAERKKAEDIERKLQEARNQLEEEKNRNALMRKHVSDLDKENSRLRTRRRRTKVDDTTDLPSWEELENEKS